MTPKTVLVTGCAGFIGSNFVRRFRERFPKTKVVGIDNFATGRREVVDSEIIFYEDSITDNRRLEKIFAEQRPEYVFHFAALPRVSYSIEHPAETTETNIYGTVLLLEKARDHGVKRFIYSSSSSIYGGAKKLPTRERENSPRPISIYGLQKWVGEPFAQLFSQLYGLQTICLRYFNVYGPGQYGDSPYATVIAAWLEQLYFPNPKLKPYLEGDGRQTRDFCYVDNAVAANLLAMKAPGKFRGEAFNIAHGERTSVNRIKTELEKLTGKKLNLERRPTRLGDVKHTLADIGAARRALGYAPQVDFLTGLRRTVEWFEKRPSGTSC